MKENTQPARELKKKQFRLAIFPRKEAVSRTEIAERTGLNLRTIASYAEEYKKLGFIVENSVPDGKGRPSICYQSNINNLLFAGISMTYDKIYIVIMDVNRYIIGARVIESCRRDGSISELITGTVKTLAVLLDEHPSKNIAGIGLCVNEYKLESKYLKAFNELYSVLKNRYTVPIIQANANSVVLDRLRQALMLHGNAAMIHLADEIRMGLFLDGKIVPSEHWQKKFSHFQVVPGGPECYCGQRGCLNSYLTHSATLKRYIGKISIPVPADFDIYKFRLLVESRDPVALELACENGVLLGKALLDLSGELDLSRIFLYAVDRVTAEKASETFRSLGGPDTISIDPCYYSASDICVGAAEMLINYYFT